ncbi:hypothetical protein [Streptomyces sp. NPDC048623]|uniref:hypothetical protein n=1 Tax=Streptomyces sp. NPDC048623 TaxID=3155761 RepID=UPI00343F3150
MLVEVDDPAHWYGEGSRHNVARLAEVRAAVEASSSPLTHLSGGALKRNYVAWGGEGPVSPALQGIRTQLAGLSEGWDGTYLAIPPTPSEDRRRWGAANK